MSPFFIIRDGSPFEENNEVRRLFVHPNYNPPSLYNDIAIVELGKFELNNEHKELKLMELVARCNA